MELQTGLPFLFKTLLFMDDTFPDTFTGFPDTFHDFPDTFTTTGHTTVFLEQASPVKSMPK
jgi:hypothetical protein